MSRDKLEGMSGTCLVRRAVFSTWTALAGFGCGLVDGGDQQTALALSFCDEEASQEVAEVLFSTKESGAVVSTVVLLDAKGQMVAQLQYPDDPERARRLDYVRNEEGHITRQSDDEGADGKVESVMSTTYDDEERALERAIDEDDDGRIDAVYVWDYSVPDQAERSYDADMDGSWDALQLVRYYESGEIRSIADDTDADGAIDAQTTYQYTDSGQMREIAIDVDADGAADTIQSYIYDSEDRLETIFLVSDDESRVTPFTETYAYDAKGRLTLVSFDSKSDGVVDRIVQVEQNADGRTVREETTTFIGGVSKTSLREYEYDGAKQVRTTSDDDGDGHWDSMTTRVTCD